MNTSHFVECPNCAKMSVREVPEPYSFMYGTENPIELTASLIVLTCEECGFRFTDGRAENIEHDTICRHLGRLTSGGIRDFRKRHQLSRADLVALGGFGEASVKRWETGALVQNASSDRFLRLIDDEAVLERLRRITEPTSPPMSAPMQAAEWVASDLPPSSASDAISRAPDGKRRDVGVNQTLNVLPFVKRRITAGHDQPTSKDVDRSILRAAASILLEASDPEATSRIASQIASSAAAMAITPPVECAKGKITFFDDGNCIYIEVIGDDISMETLHITRNERNSYSVSRSDVFPSLFEVIGLSQIDAARLRSAIINATGTFFIDWD